MALSKYLLCARVVGTHGVRGNVRLENYCDSPKVLAGLRTLYLKNGENYIPHNVEKASVQKDAVLAKLEGIDSLEDAMLWKGKELFASRDDFKLRRGEHFVADQIGLPVINDENGEIIGSVREIMTGRIQDIYVIEDVNGGTFMIPSVPDFIISVTVEGESAGVRVSLIEGMRSE